MELSAGADELELAAADTSAESGAATATVTATGGDHIADSFAAPDYCGGFAAVPAESGVSHAFADDNDAGVEAAEPDAELDAAAPAESAGETCSLVGP